MKPAARLLPLLAALAAVILAGCATPASRIQSDPAAFARLTPDEQALVKTGQIAVGFQMDAVRLALGQPDLITVHTDASGETQTWHYVADDPYDPGITYYAGSHYRRGDVWIGPPYAPYQGPVHDRIRVLFDRAGRVVSIQQDLPAS